MSALAGTSRDVRAAAAPRTPKRWTLRWMLGAIRYIFVRVRTRPLLEAKILELPRVAPAIPVRYRFGDAGDLERLTPEEHGYDEGAKREARQRLAQGDWLVLGEHDGRVVFCEWLMFGEIPTGAGGIRRISQTCVYSYKLFTAPDFRGKGIAPGVYGFIGPVLAAQGYRRLVCWVSDRNDASMRMHARAGFTHVATAYEIRLLGYWRFYVWSERLLRILMRSDT